MGLDPGAPRQERAVFKVRQHVTREQVALGGMRVAGQREGFHAKLDVLAQLGQDLIRVADDSSASTRSRPPDADDVRAPGP